MDGQPCPGCSTRDRAIDELKKRVAELEKRLDETHRTAKRQAGPFAKGPPKDRPKKPGRKAGHQHGQHAHRPPPPAEAIDETLEAPLPEACPHCGGDIQEDAQVDEQFQTDIPTKPDELPQFGRQAGPGQAPEHGQRSTEATHADTGHPVTKIADRR